MVNVDFHQCKFILLLIIVLLEQHYNHSEQIAKHPPGELVGKIASSI
jgi:hypothetical protein